MRSLRSGRTRHWTMRDVHGEETHAPLTETIVVNDPNAMQEAALLGLGVAMLATADALPALETGRLVRLTLAVLRRRGDFHLLWIAYLGPRKNTRVCRLGRSGV